MYIKICVYIYICIHAYPYASCIYRQYIHIKYIYIYAYDIKCVFHILSNTFTNIYCFIRSCTAAEADLSCPFPSHARRRHHCHCGPLKPLIELVKKNQLWMHVLCGDSMMKLLFVCWRKLMLCGRYTLICSKESVLQAGGFLFWVSAVQLQHASPVKYMHSRSGLVAVLSLPCRVYIHSQVNRIWPINLALSSCFGSSSADRYIGIYTLNI